MKYYQLIISPKYKNKHQRRADFVSFTVNGEVKVWKELNYTHHTFTTKRSEIDQITLEIKDATEKNNAPYPNFISVFGPFSAVGENVAKFLNNNNIPHYTFNTKVINDTHKYDFIVLKDVLTLNFEKSQAILKDDRVVTIGKNYMDSEIVLDSPKKNFSGLGAINYYPNILICNQIMKEKLEKEKFTGVTFKEIQVI